MFKTADQCEAYEALVRGWLDMSGHRYRNFVHDEDHCQIRVGVSKYSGDACTEPTDWAGDRVIKLRQFLHAEDASFHGYDDGKDHSHDLLRITYSQPAVELVNSILKGTHADVR